MEVASEMLKGFGISLCTPGPCLHTGNVPGHAVALGEGHRPLQQLELMEVGLLSSQQL